MFKEDSVFIFRGGDLLLLHGALPGADDAAALPLEDSGSFGSLQPSGCAWGRMNKNEPLPEGWTAIDRRTFGIRFGQEAFRIMSTAWGLMDWKSQAQYCGRCGTKMEQSPTDERAMKCPKCGHMLFPVICPAMIVAVERDGKLLLAVNKMNKTGRYSVLAGFLEVGESIEDAVVREVREEVGVEVDRDSIEYLYSQYWPFPRSLMLACRAKWKSGELAPDGTEIATARWFAPSEIPTNIPGTITVAGWLIRDFLRRHGAPLPADE